MSRQERWRGRGLRIERSSKRRIQRIHLNPRRFSEGAFREIVRYQIHSAHPREFVIAGAVLGLGLLFIYSEKKKFYPAMPFITAGIFLGMLISYLVM